MTTANRMIQIASANDAKHAHIPQEDKEKVVAEANGALQWLEEKQKLQSSLRPTDDPVLLSSDIAKKESTLQRFAEPILNKPAPPPPKAEKKEMPKEPEAMETDAAAAANASTGGADASAEATAQAGAAEAVPEVSEPMAE